MRRPFAPAAAALSMLLFATGCSDEIEEICEEIEDCGFGVTESQCLTSLSPYEYNDECKDLMHNASCDDHQNLSYWDNCWSPCSSPVQSCDGIQLTTCDEGFLVTIDCERLCNATGLHSAGECGRISSRGDVADNEVCWCLIYQ